MRAFMVSELGGAELLQLRAAAALPNQGKLKSQVSRVLELEKVGQDHRLLEAGHVTGKLVVRLKP